MPFIHANGHRVHYRLEGPDAAPVVIFSNSLGTRFTMWDAQAAALRDRYRVLRYDARGQGDSEVTPGPYSIDLLGRDVVALADALGLGRFHFCGLSMGGLIGLWLGLNAGSRLGRLVVANTAARVGTAEIWNARIATVEARGMPEIAVAAYGRWFTEAFVKRSPELAEPIRQGLLDANPAGYAASCAAVRDADFRDSVARIATPLLYIGGTFDPVTTIADGQFVVTRVPGARLVELPASHLSNIESAAEFTAALQTFLET
ncbi:MAG: 3-oxoadipate enol-lactonase [Pseudomonadota bacterium]|jgi:3-oxoadipate enol-lactonase